MTRCTWFDTQEGCRLGLVEGVPDSSTCDACESYAGPPRGLGDRIAKATAATGIDRVVEAVSRVTGKDCGCKERRRRLNAKHPSKD